MYFDALLFYTDTVMYRIKCTLVLNFLGRWDWFEGEVCVRPYLCLHVFFSYIGFVAEHCTDEGAIRHVDNNVVSACVNGSLTTVCHSSAYHFRESIAEAACSSQGQLVDRK